jgi:hypothetical protein
MQIVFGALVFVIPAVFAYFVWRAVKSDRRVGRQKGLGLSQRFQFSLEEELVVVEGLFESGHELAAKNFLQYRLGKKVVLWGANPVGVLEGILRSSGVN